MKTRDDDVQHDGCDGGADDAGGAVGESESDAKQHVSENRLKVDSKFSVGVFSPTKLLDDSLLKKVKKYSSLTNHHSPNRSSSSKLERKQIENNIANNIENNKNKGNQK